VGVDVFFVISGYLISSNILEDVVASRFSLVSFYERRVRRIFPALIVMLLATTALAYISLLPSELEEFAQSLLSATFSTSNFYFWRHVGYFTGSGNALLHTWSLAVEEQFYIVFPLFVMLLYRYFPKKLRATVIIVATISFVVSAVGAFTSQAATFFWHILELGNYSSGPCWHYICFRRPAGRCGET
jgi:peptidoglycan/LPS O-acetylase OafA/YrhL